MATVKNKKEVKPNKKKQGLTDNQRWVYGFMLLFFSLFILVSVVSYYFFWADDQNAVAFSSVWDREINVYNYGGKLGSVVSNYLVGQWFGVFGVVIPVILVILALRIMRYRPTYLNKSVRIAVFVMILGSLTLGLLFSTKWNVFGTGLGGAHGIYVSAWLSSFLGFLGALLLLVFAWVLLAVYMNRNTINVVNKFGQKLADNGMKVGGVVTEFVKKNPHSNENEDVEEDLYAGDDGSEDDLMQEDDEENATPDRETENGESYGNQNDKENASGDSGIEIIIHNEDDIKAELAAGSALDKAAHTGVVAVTEGVFTVITPADEFDAERQGAVRNEDNKPSDLPWDVIRVDGDEEVVGDSADYNAGGSDKAQAGGPEVIELGGGWSDVQPRAPKIVEAGSVLNELEVIVPGAKEVELEDEDIEARLYDPTRELSSYKRPSVDLLEDHSVEVVVTEQEIVENKNQIVRTLENFGIKIDRIKATVGPTVTLYEIVPAPGVRISKIKNLEDDIALSLSALGIRIIAPIPGKGTIGIEVPNKDKKIVSMHSMVRSQKFQDSDYDLPVVLGKTIQNETFVIDLAKMPHLLVAGATGQGKSVGLNAIITSLLYKKHPAHLKFVLVDPKKVELTLYKRLEKHFLAKMPGEDDAIITDTHKVIYTLNSLCVEMDARYELLRQAEVRHIKEYNGKFTNRRLNPNKGHRYLPYIVVIIDEFADMIMTAGREIEQPIARIAQLARAVGIHLVIATQRPTTNIITGIIKANFPARIAFRVTSMIDSRTIIDQPGANQLIGRGDMLVSTGSDLTRVQCAFVDTPEIEKIMEFISNQRGYVTPYELPEYSPDGDDSSSKNVDMSRLDPMFGDVARFIVQNQQGSTSSVQRRFSIGYNRAGRIMDQIEAAGIVGKAEGSKPREVLITDMNSLEMILDNMDSL